MYIKSILLSFVTIIAVSTMVIPFHLSALAAEVHKIAFMDSKWDGKSIPDGQICTAQGGENPHTPKLKITNLPSGTNYLLMIITDEDAGENGAHGIFRLEVPSGATEVIFPPIHETAKAMPPGVTLEKREGWVMSRGGHYLPPCSNRRNHNYYSDITAFGEGDKKITNNYIDWGKY